MYSLYNLYYPRLRSEKVCGQIYPEPKARDIFDYKLPMTEVEGSIYRECIVMRLWYIYDIVVTSIKQQKTIPSSNNSGG